MKYITAFFILFLLSHTSFAQRTKNARQQKAAPDTALPPRTVVVTSEFAPALKQTSKINFNGATPLPDSARPKLDYNIPVQNLSFAYKSPELKALAESIDSNARWNNTNFIKLGFGNYTTPYAQAGLSLGDGVNSVINLNGFFTSSNGSLPYQNYNKLSLEGIGIFTSPNHKNEWNANAYFKGTTQYLYGFQPDSLKFDKSDLRQRFASFGARLGLRNKIKNDFGIDYNPSIGFNAFGDNHSGKEFTFMYDVPVTKSITDVFDFNVGINGSFSRFNGDTVTIKNSIFNVEPSLAYKTSNIKIVAGLTPSWNKSEFSLLPNFTADVKLNEEKFILQAGFIGYYNRNTYQTLADFNPFIQQPTELINSLVKEFYGGFKGSAGDHFTYNARVSFLKINNQPLFINDTATGKSFQVVYEPGINSMRVHGEIGYTAGEKFSALGGITLNKYAGLDVYDKAFGLIPTEINAAIRYVAVKDLLLKADAYFWDGSAYSTKTISTGKLDPAFDLNLGAEFAFLQQWKAWLQFNNVFNNKYERWKQYPALGFNMLIGVVYSFGDLKTK
ncbi:hypothetical protein [Parafilimonas sp.]|uniref:hypothetical protein n=1 Tax=Parafilimonas sp. TaxID=1969739 RepID=UPI0039E2AC48